MGVQSLLGQHPRLLRITAARFEAMAEAGVFADLPGVELREGLLVQMNPQHMPHLNAKTEVYDALRDVLRDLGLPLRVASEGSVRVSDTEVPQPDIFVWDRLVGRGPVPVERVRLAVEISDTTQADDLDRKRALYASAGVPEYWVVDLAARVIHQSWAPAEGDYAETALVPFGIVLRSATLPGVAIETAALREDAL